MTTLRDAADEVIAFHQLPLASSSRIDDVVRAVENGTSATLVLAGPPATGKSTLVRAVHKAVTKGMSETRLLEISHCCDREPWQAVVFSRISQTGSTNLAESYDAMHLCIAKGFFQSISDDLVSLLHDDQVAVTWKMPYGRFISLMKNIAGVTYDREHGLTALVRLPRIRTLIDRAGMVPNDEHHAGAVMLTRRRLN